MDVIGNIASILNLLLISIDRYVYSLYTFVEFNVIGVRWGVGGGGCRRGSGEGSIRNARKLYFSSVYAPRRYLYLLHSIFNQVGMLLHSQIKNSCCKSNSLQASKSKS